MNDRRSTLPARRSPLIGRVGDVAALRDRLLHGDHRLVTVTGAAGTGKTTVAFETARQVEPLVPDGVWPVDLSVVRDPAEAPFALMEALGIVSQQRAPLEALADHLAARQALIVLDNCEHLLPALAEHVDSLLDGAPDLLVLATSRSALRLRDEAVYPLRPFDVPAAGVVEPAELASVESVRLFAVRATALDPSFTMTAETAVAVASICRRLDGIPLAIELAAAQTSVLAPAEIDERLAWSGQLPAAGRGVPERQRTMDATLDWSYEVLDPVEQALFRRLGVFAGGWTLEAAEFVGSLGQPDAPILPVLARLVDHSLVAREGDGGRSRYRMLAPIGEYASRKLAASGETAAAATAHATYYLRLTTSPHASLGQCLPEDLDRQAGEHENALAALRFAEESGVTPIRLGFLWNLTMLWRVRGHSHLAIHHLTSALGVAPAESLERASLLGVLAEFQQVIGEYDEAESRALEAATIFRAMGHSAGERTMIAQQGMAAAGRGDFERALAEFERAKPLVDAVPDDTTLGYWHAGVGRFNLGLGRLEAAERHLLEAREHFAREPSWFIGRVLALLATIARRTGDLDRSAALFGEALGSLRDYGATVEAIACLEDVARLALDRHDPGRAATLLAAATALRDATGTRASVPEHEQRSGDIERVRSALVPRAFDAAWALGLGMSLDDATTFATSAPDALPAPRSSLRGSALTPREREIAKLVALGLTNREIADRLVIAPGTVKIHVERILGKLGRTSRVQIATWSLEDRSAEGQPPLPD